MNINKSKLNQEIPCVWITAIFTFVAAFGWNIVVTILVELFEINKLGSRGLAIKFMDKMAQSSLLYQIILGIGTELIMLVTAYLIVKKFNHDFFKVSSIKLRIKDRYHRNLFVFGVIAAILLNLIILGVLCIVGYATYNGSDYFDSSIKSIVVSFLSASILGISAAVEEIIFRGIILNKLLKSKGKVFALVVSSVIFSINHINRLDIWYVIYVFIIGIFLGSLYILSNSLCLSLGFHIAWNTLSYLICISGDNYISIKNLMKFEINAQIYFLSVILGCALLLLVFFILHKRGIIIKKSEINSNLKLN